MVKFISCTAVNTVDQLFSEKQRAQLSLLKSIIKKQKNEDIQRSLMLMFSGLLTKVNLTYHTGNTATRDGQGNASAFQYYRYRIAPDPKDVNVSKYFELRYQKVTEAKKEVAYTITEAGRYFVTVTGNNGCLNSDTININYLNTPVVNLGNNGTICPRNSIPINPAIRNVTYLWQDGSTQPTYTVTEPGTYTLTARNICGGSTSKVEFQRGLCRLFMPDAFSPNKDGLNDVFRVKYSDFIKTFHLSIFNRWGKIVFETSDPKEGWDGTYKNSELDPGGYTWVVSLPTLRTLRKMQKERYY